MRLPEGTPVDRLIKGCARARHHEDIKHDKEAKHTVQIISEVLKKQTGWEQLQMITNQKSLEQVYIELLKSKELRIKALQYKKRTVNRNDLNEHEDIGKARRELLVQIIATAADYDTVCYIAGSLKKERPLPDKRTVYINPELSSLDIEYIS